MTGNPQNRGPQVGQHIGDYEIVSHLARGDMGEVFLAHHPKSGRQLAIKVLDAELCADPQLLRFYEHEVWTVNHLDHPAIVDVVDFGKLDGGRAYLVMKFLRGRSLADHLAEHGQFSPEQARDLIMPALDALVAVHGAGVTHKDLKPSNIFLVQGSDGGFAPQLLDTGLAHLKPLAAVPGSAAQLASGAMPLYKPPEQIAGDLQAVGPWSDIYAVAALLYHLMGGRPPFIGSTAQQLADQHLNAPPPDLTILRSDVHPVLAKVLQQALAKRPADRFATMEAFLNAFKSASSRPAPTLQGPTAVPGEAAGPTPVAPAPPVAPVAPDPPPPTMYLGQASPQAPRQDQTPPPTMRMDAVQFPLPGAAPPAAPPAAAPMMAPPPAAAAYEPPQVAAGPPAPPTPMPSEPHRGVGLWIAFGVGGLLLLVAVVSGLILALRSDGSKEQKSDTVKAQKDPSTPRAQPAMRVSAPPSVVAMASPPVVKLPRADRYRIDIRSRPWKGAEHARATVVVYCGFSGYYCRSSRENFRRIVRDYPQDVKLVWMDYPLGYYKRAMPAAVAAAEVFAQRGRAGFWKMHDRIYENPYKHTDDNLVKWALEAGADSVKVRSAITTLSHQVAINEMMKKAKTIGVHFTPAVFVNGVRLPNAKTYDDLQARVKSEIALAKATIGKGGVTLKGYYAHVQRYALTKKGGGLALTPIKPYKPHKPYKPYKASSTLYHVPVTKKSPQLGPADGLVTLVLFGDFQCVFTFRLMCALRVTLRHFSKDVRLVWMNNPRPYHKRAFPAAEAAVEAFAQKGNRGFWPMLNGIFPMDLCKSDGSYRFGFFRRRGELTDAGLAKRARKAGLRMSRYKRAMRLHTHKDRIQSEQKLAKGHWAYSTPTMFINGEKVISTKTAAELKILLEAARKKARKTLVTKRVSKAKLYDTIIANGRKPKSWP